MNSYKMNLKFFVISLFYMCTIEDGYSRLSPETADLTNLNNALPNIRESLSDCPMYYYRYGESSLVAPAAGAPAYLREFAHMAAIGWTNADGSIDWDCGGSLITENIILTAAHCTSRENVAPDVARMGDLNLFSDQDDKYAQQIKIVNIVRHESYKFSSNYFDIALLYLEEPIKVHDTVCPACLWNAHKYEFPKLEATGWGDTGFGEKRTPILLKVTLKPSPNPDCSLFYDTNRKLQNGIVDEQLCAGDEKMDTCPGDSGGPLQIKLLGNSRITPFIIGVTSFGPACGLSTPAVYTRVSSYIDWIESKTNTSFEPIACTLRFAKYRDYEPDIITSKTEDFETHDFSKAHVEDARPYNNKVLLGTGANKKQFKQLTVGVLISDNYVVTTASSLAANKISPTTALVSSGLIDIAKIIVHPKFERSTHANDIALIRLQKDVILNKDNELPSCLWRNKNLPNLEQFDGIGQGPVNINGYAAPENYSLTPINLKFNEINKTECSDIYQNYQSVPFLGQEIDVRKGFTNDQICAGYTRFYLVPGLCNFEYGNTMQRKLYFNQKFFIYDLGLNSFGHQCGFGVPAILTRISSYVDWIDSIVFNKGSNNFQQIDSQGGLHFSDDDYKLGDKCMYKQKNDGECVAPENCPELTNAFKTKRTSFVFCAFQPTVSICCPQTMIKKQVKVGSRNQNPNICASSFLQEKIKYESLDYTDWKMGKYYSFHHFYRREENIAIGAFPHTALISNGDANQQPCVGSLISLNYVLASARCVTAMSKPNLIRLGVNSTQGTSKSEQKFGIADVVVHPEFLSKHTIDMALIKMDKNARVNLNVIPACLWQNKTHTPFELFSLGLGEASNIAVGKKIPIYNADCKRKFYQNLNDDDLCADTLDEGEANCDERGDNILSTIWLENTVVNHYIVGIFSQVDKCKTSPSVYQRISSSIDWINLIIT